MKESATTLALGTIASYLIRNYSIELISGVFENSGLCAIYALEDVVFYIAVYGLYKP